MTDTRHLFQLSTLVSLRKVKKVREKIKVGSDFSGVGAFNQALNRLKVDYEKVFACDMDKYARNTYVLNFGTDEDRELLKNPEVKKIDDIYYRGFVNTKGKKPTQEEWDFVSENEERVARLFSFYYPWNVYSRVVPEESLDISVHTCPCQSFSLAGKRKGEDDKRGILFYNSHEFIQKNKPRFFIFENVKGLLSDDKVGKKSQYGRTFQKWIEYLGGKSVNGNQTLFPSSESVPYHIYFKVLNAKKHGIPQNRERIFIVGIRDDEDNQFTWPKEIPLVKRLKDVLETEVAEKYFLSDKMVEGLINNKGKSYINQDTQASQVFSENGITPTISAGTHGYANGYVETTIGTWRTHEDGRGFRATEDNNCPTIPARAREDGSGQPVIKIGAIRGRNLQNPLSRVSGLETEQMLEINENGTSNALTTVQKDNVVIIPANNSKGYDIAEEEEDSINFSVPSSETRRGRVGHGVSQTLDTACNQGIATRQLTKQQLEKLENLQVDENVAGCITHAIGRAGSSDEYIASVKRNAMITQRIRRLTEKECFKLMDFNFGIPGVKDFVWDVSSSQAYKQAGNSICVGVLVGILEPIVKILNNER